MAKRGPKPRRDKVVWSPDLAYAIGLITTDGYLAKNSSLIDLTSKDIEQLENFKKCLDLDSKITYKSSGYTGKKCSRVQFKDVTLHTFLKEEVGLTTAKTKTMTSLNIPRRYLFDFLRGHLDGDGTFYSYWDNRWAASFMFYTVFIAYNKDHLDWIREELQALLGITGHMNKNGTIHQLKYAKEESLLLLRKIYHSPQVICLSRKRLKIEKALSIVGESL